MDAALHPTAPPTRTFAGHAVAPRVLACMLDTPTLADVEVVVGSTTFACHRAVLAASSPVFRAMFESGMKEARSGRLALPEDVPAPVFGAVRAFLYGRPLTVPNGLALSLSSFVRRYEVALHDLAPFLDALLASALALDNVLAVRQHAHAHNALRLRRACDRFVAARVMQLPHTPAFLAAPADAAATALRAPTCVSRTALARRSAQHVFAAAVAWLRHDEARVEASLDDILATVDLADLSLPALVRASREPLVARSAAFERRLLRAFAAKAERYLPAPREDGPHAAAAAASPSVPPPVPPDPAPPLRPRALQHDPRLLGLPRTMSFPRPRASPHAAPSVLHQHAHALSYGRYGRVARRASTSSVGHAYGTASASASASASTPGSASGSLAASPPLDAPPLLPPPPLPPPPPAPHPHDEYYGDPPG